MDKAASRIRLHTIMIVLGNLVYKGKFHITH